MISWITGMQKSGTRGRVNTVQLHPLESRGEIETGVGAGKWSHCPPSALLDRILSARRARSPCGVAHFLEGVTSTCLCLDWTIGHRRRLIRSVVDTFFAGYDAGSFSRKSPAFAFPRRARTLPETHFKTSPLTSTLRGVAASNVLAMGRTDYVGKIRSDSEGAALFARQQNERLPAWRIPYVRSTSEYPFGRIRASECGGPPAVLLSLPVCQARDYAIDTSSPRSR